LDYTGGDGGESITTITIITIPRSTSYSWFDFEAWNGEETK
jgi:hypothetical protein